jgi:hypothetical protein
VSDAETRDPGSLKAILVSRISAKKPGDILSIDKLEKDIKGYARWELVSAFKDLETLGFGRFVSGRRGHPSRFLVGSNPNMPGPEAGPPQPDAQPSGLSGRVAGSDGYLMNVYFFRSSPAASISLPMDLTREEADHIIRWVQALPREKFGNSPD